MTEIRAQELIQQLKLEPHPEGGHFREVYRSANEHSGRAVVTSIYFLLQAGEISRLHQVDADEIWHWIEGAPLRLHALPPDLSTSHELTLGQPERGQEAIHVIPAEHWQAAESTGAYTLVSCDVAPGFQVEGFRFLDPDSETHTLRNTAPHLERFI